MLPCHVPFTHDVTLLWCLHAWRWPSKGVTALAAAVSQVAVPAIEPDLRAPACAHR